jgi:hypothetical protein
MSPERSPKRSGASRRLTNEPLGVQYLRKHPARLNAYQRKFIAAAFSEPFTFWVIEDVIAAKEIVLRDLFLDRTFTVKEANASEVLEPGDVLFARVVTVDGQAIVFGVAPTVLPPEAHLRLLDLRDSLERILREEGLELNLETLHMLDVQLRRAYLGTVEALNDPARPELQNTDGDPLSFVKLYFDLDCSPEEAFEALKPLSPAESPDILEDSIRDDDGNLVEVNFDWIKKGNKLHKHWDNTVLGNIAIKGNVLTAEVNSEKRAKKFRSEVKKRLGAKARYKTGVHQSVESKLEELQAGQSRSDEARREREEFESLPEVQEFVRKEMEAHWENWYDMRLPALKNKTPLEAVRTKAGRERLEALLRHFELMNEDAPQPSLKVDVRAMRKRLGL